MTASGNDMGETICITCIMYKTLTYSNFDAFYINFDMVLYYMYFYVPWFINISK